MNIPINWDLVTSDVKQFSFEGEQKTAKVVDVYDGDTIKVVFALNEKVFKFNCRITGVDTPEVRTKNKLEKEMGLKVRDELRKKILNKVVTIYCDEFDKYGRLLINLKLDNEEESIKDWLINNKYAFPYDGGTKQDWGEFLENQ